MLGAWMVGYCHAGWGVTEPCDRILRSNIVTHVTLVVNVTAAGLSAFFGGPLLPIPSHTSKDADTQECSSLSWAKSNIFKISGILTGCRICLSQPSIVHWLSSSIFPYWLVVCPAVVTPVQISLLVAPHPQTHTFSESL